MNLQNKLMDAIAGMRNLARFERAMGVSKKSDKPGTRKSKKKTQKGAIHVVNPTFKARQILAMTPAYYRKSHKGQVVMVPNYLQPHPAPKWRNRYEPQLDR